MIQIYIYGTSQIFATTCENVSHNMHSNMAHASGP